MHKPHHISVNIRLEFVQQSNQAVQRLLTSLFDDLFCNIPRTECIGLQVHIFIWYVRYDLTGILLYTSFAAYASSHDRACTPNVTFKNHIKQNTCTCFEACNTAPCM